MDNMDITTIQVSELNDLFEVDGSDHSQKIVNFNGDPVAYGVASWRASLSAGLKFMTLSKDRPSADDFIQAQKIRSYYQSKIMFAKLANKTVSAFQEKLYKFLTDGKITLGDIGMLYRLPLFYKEDTEFDTLINEFASTGIEPEFGVPQPKRIHDTILPHQKIMQSRKRGDVTLLFYKTSNGNASFLRVEDSNPLKSIALHFFNSGYPLTVQAHAWHRNKFTQSRNFGYLELKNLMIERVHYETSI